MTNKVLKDLGLDYSDKYLTIKNYAYYLIKTTLKNPKTFLNTLMILADVCRDLNYDKEYMDFYLLYYAKDELNDFYEQSYWNGANRDNIDMIVTEKFNDWIEKYELEKN